MIHEPLIGLLSSLIIGIAVGAIAFEVVALTQGYLSKRRG